MIAGATTGPLDNFLSVLGTDHHNGATHGDGNVFTDGALAGAQSAGQQLHHTDVALKPVNLFDVVGPHFDVGHQTGNRRKGDPRLAQRRQNVFNVVQEQGVGADDQNSLTLQRGAVGKEEVSGAVQRDGRLAGAGSTLHEQDAGQGVANDLVLLTLNRRHNVAHATGAGPAQCGEQRARSAEGETTFDQAFFGRGALGSLGDVQFTIGVGEVLIFDAHHFPAANGHVTATREPERLNSRGAVEGFGDGGAPVDDERIEVVVGNGQATNVKRLALAATVIVEVVDTAEEEGLVTNRELFEALQRGTHHHVSFDEVAGTTSRSHGDGVAKRAGLLAHVLQGR